MANELPPARFQGIVIYQDPEGVFEVRYPLNWHKFDVAHQSGGVLFSPYPDYTAVWVAVWKEMLPRPVYARDVNSLRLGLDEGIRLLGEEVQILDQHEDVIGDLIRFERITLFRNGETRSQRRHWLFYAHKNQINLVYQARQDEYKHWSGMAYYAFHTFRLPEHLWFAADPDQHDGAVDTRKDGNQKRSKKLSQ